MSGAILGDILGKAFDQTWSNVWNANAFKMSQEQFEYQKYYNKNKINMTIADMRRAGINPLLALGGGVGTGGQTSVAPPPHGGSTGGNLNLASSMASASQARTAEKQIDLARRQVEVQERNAEVQERNASSTERQTAINMERTLSDMEVNDATKQLTEQKAQSEIVVQQQGMHGLNKIDKEAALIAAQTNKAIKDANLSSAYERKVNEEKLQIMYDNYRAEAQKGMYKGTMGKIMSYTEWLTSILFGGQAPIDVINRNRTTRYK